MKGTETSIENKSGSSLWLVAFIMKFLIFSYISHYILDPSGKYEDGFLINN